MKLYTMPASCALAPHIVAHELGLDLELCRVDHTRHVTEEGDDFLSLNPHGYVPVLVLDDGSLLREGPAILQYLADLKPQHRLAPPNGSLARYRLQEMLGFLNSEIHKGFVPLLYARLAGRYIETARPKLEARYAWIDRLLADRAFLMGADFTVADAYLYALTGWGQASWLTSYYRADIHFDALHHLAAWYGRVRTRDSVRRALREEGLEAAAGPAPQNG
ncbi:glutathione S-transferase N-terminal domain-containing protein [Methylobacterium sp. E-005]|uniref:glutathione S-transferase N-terminal domain-containing protein n=1 Tax=Methylobacterium sp. E-005 TaxID=2836549 RepID=UPI001FB9334D|nr:glutathione S-transferase N-terminal domain-containing protein [Methylobacterium sp. E-005]MCJ2086039.1 glutathione S-transferase N-terminal domain-containing protein [Methylobacterium sp. E-005]